MTPVTPRAKGRPSPPLGGPLASWRSPSRPHAGWVLLRRGVLGGSRQGPWGGQEPSRPRDEAQPVAGQWGPERGQAAVTRGTGRKGRVEPRAALCAPCACCSRSPPALASTPRVPASSSSRESGVPALAASSRQHDGQSHPHPQGLCPQPLQDPVVTEPQASRARSTSARPWVAQHSSGSHVATLGLRWPPGRTQTPGPQPGAGVEGALSLGRGLGFGPAP